MPLPTIEDMRGTNLPFLALTIFTNLFLLPFIPLLLVLRYIFSIKFIRLRSDRIGHLAANTEEFFREINACQRKKLHYVALAPSKVANSALIDIWKRQINIVQFPQPAVVRVVMKIAATRSLLSITDCFEAINFKEDNLLWNTEKPTISFTTTEENEGQKLLNKMNVDSWFICFHARDSAYLGQQWKKGDWQHSHRNCSIENFMEAATYITQQGGFALRMGSVVEKKLHSTPLHVIDYATIHRTEFGDIYLMSKCKFFLGNTAGIVCLSYIFNVPNITTNLQVITIPPVGKDDLFIPKKIWYKHEKRFLTFKEMIEEIPWEGDATYFELVGLVFIENTSEEILAVTKEMNERIDGTLITTDEDEKLQQAFKSLYKKGPHCFGPPPGRIGTHFLRENKELL